MLTKLAIRNFKRLKDCEIPLGQNVVLIGPNNSGKTTALQALALWDTGLRAWLAERGGDSPPEKRPGVTINRKDLITIPVPAANLLWSELHVRSVENRRTSNIRIEILAEGRSATGTWECGFEFDFTSQEALVCRPLRLPGHEHARVQDARFRPVPQQVADNPPRLCFLPPMSGLASIEPKVEQGRIDVLLGEGQTAQVLRNLCFLAHQADPRSWDDICTTMKSWFGIQLEEPQFLAQRGEISLCYRENEHELDISSSGRGAQQTLLLLAYLHVNPGAIVLLDEPDAHLEILRQRQVYNGITQLGNRLGSQIIAASHSEVVLNEAAGSHDVVAFVGRPHQLAKGKPDQLLKALREIGFEHYVQAEQTGWVLYLEDVTDLHALQAFASLLKHPAEQHLARPFVHYIRTNVPQDARRHFFGLIEAKPDLVGLALFDRLDKPLQEHDQLIEVAWRRREIENYFTAREVLVRFARSLRSEHGPLFDEAASDARAAHMEQAIRALEASMKTQRRPDPWSADIKASDEFLDPLFQNFSEALGVPLCLRKGRYAELIQLLEPQEVDREVYEKLDAIADLASKARPFA